MSTSVAIKTQYSTTTVEVPQDDMTFPDFFELVLEPAIVSIYGQEIIDKYLGDQG